LYVSCTCWIVSSHVYGFPGFPSLVLATWSNSKCTCSLGYVAFIYFFRFDLELPTSDGEEEKEEDMTVVARVSHNL
jgi:hypothetical protein